MTQIELLNEKIRLLEELNSYKHEPDWKYSLESNYDRYQEIADKIDILTEQIKAEPEAKEANNPDTIIWDNVDKAGKTTSDYPDIIIWKGIKYRKL